ncbi:MAG: DUF4167 domain-containing protein [Erythrobacter sp.]|uniref:DUF4167 domain-containing protein n=1 Tax=Erythrobacter sp. TaxID=1042 RepID=UPI0025F35028|nr:DUF4167 domain-containing protein [Erythrobacter sp.]MCL9997817.1 DUF4167 domain-containing protein [Erythrobacter sp.]
MNNNNRNNRRRGRGNRNQGGGGAQLNRIDSRARGNAPQMLDKYKKLAQDAHHNGDRVQMEYYLQFADHYFRVIADNKARLDEQRGGNGAGRRNEERDQNEEYGEDDFDFGRRSEAPTRSAYEQPDNIGNTDLSEGEPGQEGESFLSDDRQDDERQNDRSEDRGGDRPRGQRRQQQQRKPKSGERDGNRPERGEKRAERPERSERPAAERPAPADRADKPVRARKPRKSADGGEHLGIDSSILPPSIRGDDSGPDNSGDSGALETVE